jgi:hypothetical protein
MCLQLQLPMAWYVLIEEEIAFIAVVEGLAEKFR